MAVQFWTTDGHGGTQALDYWMDVMSREMITLAIAPVEATSYRSSLTKTAFGQGGLCTVLSSPQVIQRSAPASLAPSENLVFLVQVKAGRATLRQYRRVAELVAGDCVIMDGGEPYELSHDEMVETQVIQLPRKWFELHCGPAEPISCVTIAHDQGWGGALSAALRACRPEDISGLALPENIVLEQLLHLVTLAIRPGRDELSAGNRMLLRRALGILKERSGEAGLAPGKVAAQLGISGSYVHRLFADAGTTFCRELMSIRLETATRMLSSPAHQGLPVSQVAYACGFIDPGHFTKRFRAMTGMSPSEFRGRGARN